MSRRRRILIIVGVGALFVLFVLAMGNFLSERRGHNATPSVANSALNHFSVPDESEGVSYATTPWYSRATFRMSSEAAMRRWCQEHDYVVSPLKEYGAPFQPLDAPGFMFSRGFLFSKGPIQGVFNADTNAATLTLVPGP